MRGFSLSNLAASLVTLLEHSVPCRKVSGPGYNTTNERSHFLAGLRGYQLRWAGVSLNIPIVSYFAESKVTGDVRCNICLRTFKGNRNVTNNLKRHMRTVHSQSPRCRTYTCGVCGAKFLTEVSYIGHCKRHCGFMMK